MNVQTLDVIYVNLWSILLSLGNLVLIYVILKKVLFGPVKKILAERQGAVDSVYAKAEMARLQAEDSRARYEDKLAHADEEAAVLLTRANERAHRAEETILANANQKAAAALKKADEDIAFEKKRAMNELKNEISSISLDIAEKVIGREISEDDHRNLIDRFIDEVDDGSARE